MTLTLYLIYIIPFIFIKIYLINNLGLFLKKIVSSHLHLDACMCMVMFFSFPSHLLTEITLKEEAYAPSIWLLSNIVHIEKEE